MKFHIILLGLLVKRSFCETIKVLTTEEDLAKHADGSGARLKKPPNVDFVDVTVSDSMTLFW